MLLVIPNLIHFKANCNISRVIYCSRTCFRDFFTKHDCIFRMENRRWKLILFLWVRFTADLIAANGEEFQPMIIKTCL
jgi:hypothetical protein